MKKVVYAAIACAAVVIVGVLAFGGGSSSVEVKSSFWYAIDEVYQDPAIQVRFTVQNTGDKTVNHYTMVFDLYDSNGTKIKTFESGSTRSLAPGDTSSGNVQLAMDRVYVRKVADVKVSAK